MIHILQFGCFILFVVILITFFVKIKKAKKEKKLAKEKAEKAAKEAAEAAKKKAGGEEKKDEHKKEGHAHDDHHHENKVVWTIKKMIFPLYDDHYHNWSIILMSGAVVYGVLFLLFWTGCWIHQHEVNDHQVLAYEKAQAVQLQQETPSNSYWKVSFLDGNDKVVSEATLGEVTHPADREVTIKLPFAGSDKSLRFNFIDGVGTWSCDYNNTHGTCQLKALPVFGSSVNYLEGTWSSSDGTDFNYHGRVIATRGRVKDELLK